jgi:hypothetical protein
MTIEEIYDFMKTESLAVLSTVTENGEPETALDLR